MELRSPALRKPCFAVSVISPMNKGNLKEMNRRLVGLYDPKTGDAGLAAFTVRALRKQGHVTTRGELLEMQQDIAGTGLKRRLSTSSPPMTPDRFFRL